MNFRISLSLIPVAIFFALTRVAPPIVSISGSFIASTIVFYYTRKDRLIGALALFGFVCVAVSAAIGIIWNSEKAYLASGPVSDFLFVPVFIVSIWMGKPLVGGIARELVPAITGNIPANARVFVGLSYAWATFNLAQGISRVYMLEVLSVGEYLIWSRLSAWPFSTALLGLSAYLIWRESERNGARQGPATEPDEDEHGDEELVPDAAVVA